MLSFNGRGCSYAASRLALDAAAESQRQKDDAGKKDDASKNADAGKKDDAGKKRDAGQKDDAGLKDDASERRLRRTRR